MKSRKYTGSLWLALIMVLSLVLAACGNGGGGGTTNTNPTSGAGASTGATATTGTTGVGTSPTATTGMTAGATGTTGMTGGATATRGPNTGGTVGKTAAPPPCPDTAKGQTVEMWSPLTGGDGDVMTALAQQFSSENKQGITVRHTAQPEYIQKLNTSAAAKKLPTMTVIRAGDIPIMAARNILKPMGAEAMAAAGGDMSKDFPQQVWGAGDIGGKRYTIPLDVHPLVLYYNKDLFKKAGIPDPGKKPMTKQQFEQAAEKLNQGGNTGWAIGTLFSSDTLFQTLVRQFGGTLVNADGTQATYNSEAGVRALNYIKEMKQKYSPKISGAGDPEVVAFQQGKVGMVLHGPWWIGSLEKLPFTGFAPTPQFGEKYAVWGGSHQLGITTDDPAQQAAAGCWIGWLSSNSVQWAKAGQVPARNSVRLGKELATVAPPVAGFATEADDVILFPPIPGLESAVMTEASKAIAAVVQGQAQDAKAALDQAAARSNQLIQQNLKTYGTPKQ